MKSLLRTLSLAGLLLCAAAPWQPLAAQAPIFAPVTGPLPTDAQTKLPPPAVIQTDAPNRVYVGSLTRTSPSGKVATGDVILSVTPQGGVRANLTFNGQVHPYYGVVLPDKSSPKTGDNRTKRRAGTLAITRTVVHPTTPGVFGIITENLALTVTQTSAYGGTTSGKGVVTFTARRFGAIVLFGTTGGITVPVGTTPASGGISLTGNGG